MTGFDFNVLKTAWNNLKKKREHELRRIAPYLTDPDEIYMKRIQEDDDYLTVQFLGFENSVSDSNSIPQVKRLIVTWIKRFSMNVQTGRGDVRTLTVRIAKEMKFSEAVEIPTEAKRAELYKLYRKSLKVMPGSPAQEKIKARIAELRQELDMNEAVEIPNEAIRVARNMLSQVSGKPLLCGDSDTVAGFSIETHTLGCRNAADEPKEQWWESHWKIYDEYANDGRSEILGDPADGTFVTITPTRGTMEAAISIFKRDPKTNKSKRYYKCIGGKKHGRRMANPNDCIGFPDFMKKMKFAMTKRQKPGQAGLGKKKTQLTNIMAKRIRKANTRLKKARGF